MNGTDIGGGWYLSKDSCIRDDEGNPVGRPNVAARFEDTEILDVPASKEAGKRVLRMAICMQSKVLLGYDNHMSPDTDAMMLRFDVEPEEAESALHRFPEAWAAYLSYRKAPAQPGEAEFMVNVMGLDPEPKPKKRQTARAGA